MKRPLLKSMLLKKALLFFISILFLSSCEKDKDLQTDVLRLNVNGFDLLIDLRTADGETFDVESLTSEFPTLCTIENYSEFNQLTIDGVDAKDGSCSFLLDRIAADREISVTYNNGNYSGTSYLRTRNSRIPKFTVSGTPVGAGDYYLSYVYLPLVMKLDNSGNLVYYSIEHKDLSQITENSGRWDFKKHVVNGKTYYSYHENDPLQNEKMANGFNPGRRVLMNDQYNIIAKYQLLASDGVKEGEAIDGHDFYLIAPGHYILSAYLDKTLTDNDFAEGVAHKEGGCNVLAAYLQEVKDGKVVFEWWSTDHKELTAYSDAVFTSSNFDFYNEVNDRPDYVHFNSMDIDSDGNLICSFRHISTIMKIDRAGGTGDIIWRLSGKGDDFNLAPEEHTSGQHFARIDANGVLTLFDNGNATATTRYRSYKLNQQTLTAEATYQEAPEQYFSQACGSVSMTSDGGYLVGCGIGTQMDHIKWFSQVNASGEEIFAITHPWENVLSYTYRVVKIP